MEFVKKNIFGRTVYQSDKIIATQANTALNVKVDGELRYSARFINVDSACKKVMKKLKNISIKDFKATILYFKDRYINYKEVY